MIRFRWFRVIPFLSFIALLAWPVFADQAIEGLVKDKSNAVIPGVQIVLTNVNTGNIRETFSDDKGLFYFNQIRTGDYELKAELEGFQPVKVTGIIVKIGDRLNYPLTLEISQVSTEIEVKAAVEQVQTTTSQLDSVIDEKRISDLPLNGRDPMSLVYLVPGVVSTTLGPPSAGGARARANNYQLDGVDNNYTSTWGSTISINTDATAEFRVVTNSMSAENGRNAGMVVDVITKSGTNNFHGSVFYFLRSENLNAKTWEENYYGWDKSDYKNTQFGASIGGPIIKDKLFFFFNTQMDRFRASTSSGDYVPSAAMRGMVVNPEIARIFNTYYPLPNQPDRTSVEIGGTAMNGYYAFPAANRSDGNQYMLKVDYNHSAAHTFSARYFFNNWETPAIPALPDLPNAMGSKGRSQSITGDWTWIINNSMVNNLRFGVNRNAPGWPRAEESSFDLSFGGGYSDYSYYCASFGGPTGYGNFPFLRNGTSQIKDTLTWTKGTHNLRFGFDIRFNYENGTNGFGLVPTGFFDPRFSGGSMLTNILNGQVDWITQTIFSDGEAFLPGSSDLRGWRQHEYDFFVQDDWKILPNLTLNLGLRYEYKPSPYEVNSLATNIEDPVANGYHLPNIYNYYDPANYDANGDFIWIGSGATISIAGPATGFDLYKAPKANFAPRAGLSWDPFGDGRTALRAGYGISYDRVYANLLNWNTSQFPFGASSTHNARPGGQYNGMLPDNAAYWGHGVAVPAITLHLEPESFYSLTLFNRDWHSPYIQTWNASVQRELWTGNILTVTYAGSSGVHLLGRCNPNQMPNPSSQLIQELENRGYYNSVPWQVYYYSVHNTQFFRAGMIDPYAHSNYNSLQTSFSHRYQNGFQVQLNYTWSKAFDNNSESVFSEAGSSNLSSNYYDPGYDRGYSTFDVRHNFSANFIYELPFGPGKWFGGNSSGLLAALIGGWQINGIMYANTGVPLDYKVPRDTLGNGYTNTRAPGRPNVASYEVVYDPANNIVGPRRSNFVDWMGDINLRNPRGNYYRGFFRGPGYWDVDFSLFKEVKTPWFTSEGAKVQFRAEAFNLFNHTNWTLPSLSLSNLDELGKTYSANANRRIQLGVKFIF